MLYFFLVLWQYQEKMLWYIVYIWDLRSCAPHVRVFFFHYTKLRKAVSFMSAYLSLKATFSIYPCLFACLAICVDITYYVYSRVCHKWVHGSKGSGWLMYLLFWLQVSEFSRDQSGFPVPSTWYVQSLFLSYQLFSQKSNMHSSVSPELSGDAYIPIYCFISSLVFYSSEGRI